MKIKAAGGVSSGRKNRTESLCKGERTVENKVIQDRLTLLRAKMQEEGIDFYMMPTADFHNSEYVNDRVSMEGRRRTVDRKMTKQNIQQGQRVGAIAYEKDLADSIWTDRPDFPAGKVTVLDEKI